MADKFTIGLVQMKCTANADENLARAIAKIREAAARGAQIISLHDFLPHQHWLASPRKSAIRRRAARRVENYPAWPRHRQRRLRCRRQSRGFRRQAAKW